MRPPRSASGSRTCLTSLRLGWGWTRAGGRPRRCSADGGRRWTRTGSPGVVAGWLAQHRPPPATGTLPAIAVDGKTIRGSGDADTAARPVLAAADHATGVVLASTAVEATTNEITRLRPLLDQIADLRGVIVTADALHCPPDHVPYLAGRGAHGILTVKGNQPHLHTQLAALPWRAVPDADRTEDRGHRRRQIRTVTVLTVAGGIDVPYAAQAMQIRRRRRAVDQPKRWTTETVDAITDLQVHQATPPSSPMPSVTTGRVRTKSPGRVTSPTTRTAARSTPAPAPTSWPPSATPPSAFSAGPAPPTSPPPPVTTPATAVPRPTPSRSVNDFAGALGSEGRPATRRALPTVRKPAAESDSPCCLCKEEPPSQRGPAGRRLAECR